RVLRTRRGGKRRGRARPRVRRSDLLLGLQARGAYCGCGDARDGGTILPFFWVSFRHELTRLRCIPSVLHKSPP
ncbi:hypothetical protein B0H10DRAFT_2430800, partial [Mycena sp. CBHHK59/15]